MGKIEDAKVIYENIEIPKELSERVNSTIEKERLLHEHQKKQGRQAGKRAKSRQKKNAMAGIVSAAAVMTVFILGLNTSSTFAAAVGKVPVLGKVAEVLTFRSYEMADADKTVSGEIPGVKIESPTVAEEAFTAEVNAKIQEKCDDYLEEAIKRVEEYKEAFVATSEGLTKEEAEEEFAKKGIEIKVGYEIKSQSGDILSFVVEGTENWVSAYAMTEYYNLDMRNLTYVTLQDLLGEDYVALANASIRAQMSAQESEDSNIIYWTEAEGGFSTVDENTKFYVNEQGLPVVVFDKYEVAPGAVGMPEFVIDPAGDLSNAQAGTTEQQTKPIEQIDPAGKVDADDGVESDADRYCGFAEKIREAFLAEDMEAAADLMAYPSYVGIDGGVIVETREDFLALSPEKIFTKEMKTELEGAKFEDLKMYEAGVTILDKPSVTFDEFEDGTFGITGINY